MKKYNILIEGPDRIGKSSLCKNIRKEFGTEISYYSMHYDFVKYEDQLGHDYKMYSDMFWLMNELDKTENKRVICDRSHIGEYVYGSLYRGKLSTWIYDLEKKYNLDNVLLVLLTTTVPEILLSRDDNNSLSNNDLCKINAELQFFNDAYEQSNIPNKIKINTAYSDIDHVFNAFKKQLENLDKPKEEHKKMVEGMIDLGIGKSKDWHNIVEDI